MPNQNNVKAQGFLQWLLFGGVVSGIGSMFHLAGSLRLGNLSKQTWDLLSIGYPSVVLLGCLFYVLVYFREASGGAFVVNAMKGVANQNPQLELALNEVYERSALPKKPNLYLIPSSEPNAFAAGTKDDCVVAVTSALLDMMTFAEVRAVIAHEIGHIQSRHVDSSIQKAAMIAALGLVTNCGRLCLQLSKRGESVPRNRNNDNDREDSRSTNWVAIGIVLIVVGFSSSILGTLIRLASSRGNEYEADAFAKDVGAGPDLVTALQKLGRMEVSAQHRRDFSSKGLGALGGAYAHAYISNPPSRESPMLSFFGLMRTHPSMQQRIARLQE